ncbi:MAG TPA: ATP-binding protein, partial [Bacillota bacterium]|nr:ATP-binding protein [Bacillota bacterium]
ISDILMPELDGFALCRQIKDSPEHRKTPVILLTALTDPRDVLRGLESGADNFIVKPFQESDLLSRIEFILANRDLEVAEKSGRPMEIMFGGERFRIAAERRQILNFFLAAYEAAVEKNTQLLAVQDQLQTANTELEKRVQERTAKLELAYKSLESFSYSIAHDLRAPLRSIQGFTSMLLNEYSSVYSETARDFSKRVMEAAERMDRLIQDLLTYGRVAQAEFPLGIVSLESVVQRPLQQLADDIQHRHAEIQVEHPLPEVRGNSTLLEQVLINLLTNALKFARDNVPPRIVLRAERRGQSVRLFVEDNGIGIAPAYLDRLFRVFERLHDASKYPGTGIGLVIVRRGVERMGGRVGVESVPEKGSKFWLELPAA